jgi:DNA-binding NtrC family response regulator
MKKPVLIIDDDQDLREVMCTALELEGYEVHTFENPLAALEALSKWNILETPGLIMVDFNMPQMNGFSFVEAIMNHHPDLQNIPLAICSAEEALPSMQNWPHGVIHMEKPMELDHFVKTVREYCG